MDIGILLHEKDTGILDQDRCFRRGHLSGEAPDGGVEDVAHLYGLELVFFDNLGCDVPREIHVENQIPAFSHHHLILELDDIGIRNRVLVGDDPEGVKCWLGHTGVGISRRRLPDQLRFSFWSGSDRDCPLDSATRKKPA